jgi:hypothetical protein
VAMMFVEAPIMEMSRVSDSGGAGNPALAYE